ncbi:nose resistant to fluoxetine protein 6-like [Cylas formicarius]|uniref:nose resistant to fluoxetine protein 6-like n=1 Tax=Cylas formicarius TaxID=197179 RepID=UPI0029588485|nr:nose resistant to fluoxetine protein 6-like [Cylas formicarius]
MRTRWLVLTLLLAPMCEAAEGGSFTSLIPFDLSDYGFILNEIFNETNACNEQIKIYFDGLDKGQDWAWRMLDATAKPQTGLATGNVLHIGNYDECLVVDHVHNASLRISGKYCTAPFDQSVSASQIDDMLGRDMSRIRTSFGFCVPRACDSADLNKVFANLESLVMSPYHLHFYDELCANGDDQKLTTLDIFAVSVFGFICLLAVLSTIYELLVCKDRKTPNLLASFSLYANAKRLFSTETSKESLGCLGGIKAISLAWIILGHRALYTLYVPLVNMADILVVFRSIFTAVVLTGGLAVDTFFLISGLLVIYVFLNARSRDPNVSWLAFYVHRILRLTPALAATILLYSTLLDDLGSGPYWFLVYYFFQKKCEDNWWSTLMYVQNYVHPTEMCVGQSWYLAVDTQLFFASPVLLVAITKWPKTTVGSILLTVCASSAYTFEVSYERSIGPAFFGMTDEMFELIYTPTHTRVAPWLIGTILGYIIYHCKGKRIKLRKVVVWFSWCLLAATFAAVVYVHQYLADDETGELVFEAALFNSTIRVLWSLALSLLILLCVTGYGGILNDILSCSYFKVLARLTYSMYLVQIIVIIYYVGRTRVPAYGAIVTMVHQFWGDYCLTLLVSVPWSLLFESPFMQIGKIVLRRS